MGKVYKARMNNSGNVYSVKVINKEKLIKMNRSIQLKREIRIHSKLDHKNICKMHGYFSDKNSFYIVLSYADKGNLFQLLKEHLVEYKRGLNENVVRTIIKNVSRAIQYCHTQNIAHRDVKPENILLKQKNGKLLVQICDFGCSAFIKSRRGSFVGTIDYLSPEMICSRSHDKKIDVWSIGVLAYELLFGHSPFWSKDKSRMKEKILTKDVKFPSKENFNVSEACKDFIRSLLEKNSMKRLSIDEVLNHEFLK